jgi:phage shock protein PspC (stress-responsive transcriptional regulator)
MARRDTSLHRDADDRMIAGVCSGLARYFDIDTTLVRVLFVALTLAGGGTIIAYLLLWVFVDPVSDTETTASHAATPTTDTEWPAPTATGESAAA